MMTMAERESLVAVILKSFDKNMAIVRELDIGGLTAQEIESCKPTIEDGAKYAWLLSSREVTERGFPVTKAGVQTLNKIQQEVDRRTQDRHDMFIFPCFDGCGVWK